MKIPITDCTRNAKCNEIIYFVLCLKLKRLDRFSTDPAKKCLYFLHKLFFITLYRKSLETDFCQQHMIVIFCLAHFLLCE